MKHLIAFVLLTFSMQTFSQDAATLKTIAKATCDCLGKRTIDYSKRQEVEMALGLCLLESAQATGMELDMSDAGAMRSLGEKVGMQMAGICPEVFSSFMEDGGGQEEESEMVTITGKVKSVDDGDFLTISLKEDSGKEHKLMWLRYFPGSDEFQDDPKKLVGKRVEITYQSLECYQPKAKIYYNNKEITNLKLRD